MVTHLEVTKKQPDELRIDVLPPQTRRAFLYCTKLSFLSRSGWYLAGGTALTLQVGHRRSVDLDFFTPQTHINVIALERTLLATGKWETTLIQEGTLYGKFAGGKMSFIAYPFFKPTALRVACGSVRMLALEDIAAMKIIAVSQRGRKRDFIDLYWYVHHREPLETVIRRALGQYPGQEHNVPHILKSLAYFENAEGDPMPTLNFKVNWRTVKLFFQREVATVTKKFLDLR